MRIVFMGTPEFAVASLDQLMSSSHNVVGVVTGPDRPSGRSLKLTKSAVKSKAEEYGLPILQPEDFKDQDFLDEFLLMKPSAAVVVAFRILPQEVYSVPQYGCINLHASLLPDLRGAAPINWAIMRGYKKTGLTTFQIERGIDTGKVLLQQALDIDNGDDFGSLSARMSFTGAELIVKTLDLLESGTINLVQQKGNGSKAPRIFKEDCLIDWNRPAVDIHNQVRGLSPVPCAYTMLEDKLLKIYRSRVLIGDNTHLPGSVLPVTDGSLLVKCGSGILQVLELQVEGKRRMDYIEFMRGRPISAGTSLG